MHAPSPDTPLYRMLFGSMGGRLPWPPHRCYFKVAVSSVLLRGELDEGREDQLAMADIARPHADLLAILPLDVDPGNKAGPHFQCMSEGAVLAIKLHAAKRTDIIRLLQRRDHFVRIRRAGTLHGIGDDEHVIIGRITVIGRRCAV